METVIQEAMRSRLSKALSFASNDSKDTDEDIRYNYDLGWANSKTFTKQLAKDNIDVDILNNELIRHAEIRRSRSLRERLLSKLRSSAAQFILCFLVLLDSCLVIAEIILEIRSIQNFKQLFTIKGRQLGSLMLTQAFRTTSLNASCLDNAGSTKASSLDSRTHNDAANGFQRLFSHTVLNDERTLEELNNFILCWQKLFSLSNNFSHSHISPVDCDSDLLIECSVVRQNSLTEQGLGEKLTDPSSLHFASEVMHFVSIGVTSLFIVCIVLKLVCLRRKFFSDVYEVIDAMVILVSFLSDICYVRVDSQEISAMVILLLWRIARLINAMLMYERQRCEFRVTLQKRARRLGEKKVDNLEREKELQQKHILALEELLRSLGSPEETIRDCKPRYALYSHFLQVQVDTDFKEIVLVTLRCKITSSARNGESGNRLGHAQIIQLLKFCLKMYFTFDGTIYEQVKGTPMGSSISEIIAEAVLQRLESLVFRHHRPKLWARYVDDTFVAIERHQVLTFKEHLNAVFPDIQFTMEEEENN
nr:unnamed protein product [Spirometra erinaceieuropaei]